MPKEKNNRQPKAAPPPSGTPQPETQPESLEERVSREARIAEELAPAATLCSIMSPYKISALGALRYIENFLGGRAKEMDPLERVMMMTMLVAEQRFFRLQFEAINAKSPQENELLTNAACKMMGKMSEMGVAIKKVRSPVAEKSTYIGQQNNAKGNQTVTYVDAAGDKKTFEVVDEVKGDCASDPLERRMKGDGKVEEKSASGDRRTKKPVDAAELV